MPTNIVVLGIDLGTNNCSVGGLDGTGQVVLRRRMQRDSVIRRCIASATGWSANARRGSTSCAPR